MALNDGVLADLGIDPVTAIAVGTALSKVIGSGPTREFQERQAYRDAKDEIVAKYLAIMPTLLEWQRLIVQKDLDDFVRRMTREGMKVEDYKRELAWFQGREAAWQTMAGPDGDVPAGAVRITPEMMYRKMHPTGDPSAYQRAAAARGPTEAPTSAGLPGAIVPSAVMPIEAGFNLPVMVVIGGLLLWWFTSKKK